MLNQDKFPILKVGIWVKANELNQVELNIYVAKMKKFPHPNASMRFITSFKLVAFQHFWNGKVDITFCFSVLTLTFVNMVTSHKSQSLLSLVLIEYYHFVLVLLSQLGTQLSTQHFKQMHNWEMF